MQKLQKSDYLKLIM